MYAVANPEQFDGTPELGMGFHFGVTKDSSSTEPLIVINGSIGLTNIDITEEVLVQFFNENLHKKIAIHGELIIHEFAVLPRTIVPSDDVDLFMSCFGRWLSHPRALLRRERLHESPPFPVSPAQPQRFVRFSAFPNDRRIRPDGSLLPGTYVTSELDAKCAPSGCAVVGRYALPNPLPAVHRFDIAVAAGFAGLAGTVAPAFGQAGGGSEIELVHGAPGGSVTGPSTIPMY